MLLSNPMRLLLAFALVFASTLNHASAQTPSANAAATRATAAHRCLQPLVQRLEGTLRLLQETQAQLASSDERVREDAAAAVVSLEQRIAATAEAIQACVPDAARLEPQTRVQELQGAAAAVGQRNAATQVLERDVPLVRNVRVVVGERVDGHGQAPSDLVRRAVRGVGGELQRCYERFLERGALQPGQAVIAFTVTNGGRTIRPSVEGVTIDDRSFQRCLRSAAAHVRVSGGSSGGDARYAYTLRFGP